MLDIFADNWENPPAPNEGERLVRILTNNPVNELYTIVSDSMDDDEIHNEIKFALRHKYGRNMEYGGYEETSYLRAFAELFQEDGLDALLGDFKDDYDVDGIIDDVTEVDYRTGNRYWKEMSEEELNKAIEAHAK